MTASGPGGSIYDLGYQSYTGPRLGRAERGPGAVQPDSIRACFGIGRGGRAKIAPFTLGAPSPSCRRSWPSASRRSPPRPVRRPAPSGTPRRSATRHYQRLVGIFIMLFCAAQAPELFGRDQRYGVLPLYFSRVLDPARLRAGQGPRADRSSLFAVAVPPYLILFVGRVFVAPDPATGLADEIAAVPQVPAPGRAGRRAPRRPRRRSSLPGRRAARTPRRRSSPCSSSRRSSSASSRAQTSQDLARVLDPVQPGRRPRRHERGDLRVDPGRPGRLPRSDLPGLGVPRQRRSIGIAATIGLTVRRYLRIAT